MSSTRAKALEALAGHCAGGTGEPAAARTGLKSHCFCENRVTDSAAADTSSLFLYAFPRPQRIKSVSIELLGGTLAHHAANNATLTVTLNDGAGGAPVTVATLTTDTASIAADTTTAIPLASTNVPASAAGYYLRLAITKGALGVVVPRAAVYGTVEDI